MSGETYELPFDHGESVPGPDTSPETERGVLDELAEYNATAPDQDEQLLAPIGKQAEPAASEPAQETPEANFERDASDLGIPPESIDALRTDPFEAIGLTSEAFVQMATGAGLEDEDFLGESLEAIAANLEAKGFSSPAEVSQVLDAMAKNKKAERDHKALLDDVARTKAELDEFKNTGPASPIDNRLARIEARLDERHEREAAMEQMQRDDTRRTALHGGACEQLARVAKHMGVEAPSGEAVAAWYDRNSAWDMDPNTAARLCFMDLGAGEVVGMKADRRTQRVVRPGATQQRLIDGEEEYARGPFIVPSGGTSIGAGRRLTVEDILADHEDIDDDGGMRVWTGGR